MDDANNDPAYGSPPCVRGGLRRELLVREGHRFTPVRTGRTITNESPWARIAVHPRAYGEDAATLAAERASVGSPPCVRGGRSPHRLRRAPARFTPVCTGRTPSRPAPPSTSPVHPRVYGEDSSLAFAALENRGSPPCVRGGRIRARPSP